MQHSKSLLYLLEGSRNGRINAFRLVFAYILVPVQAFFSDLVIYGMTRRYHVNSIDVEPVITFAVLTYGLGYFL